jgi:hypothetical protein
MELPHAGLRAFRVPRALSLMKGNFCNARGTTRNQHCHERAPFPCAARPQSGESIRRLPDVSAGGPEMTNDQNGQGRKVLTGFLAFCGLVFVIGVAAGCDAASSSTPVAAASSLTAKAPVVTPSPAVTKAATAAQAVTTAPSASAQTTTAPPSPQAPTAAAPQRTAPSTPAQTTSAAPPAPPASPAPASCYPLSNKGTCYEPGEFCRNADHGKSGVAGDGKAIKCEDNDGWRWEPV